MEFILPPSQKKDKQTQASALNTSLSADKIFQTVD